ncbi:polyprenyl synthetase family protein [Pseudarthrobacter sp. J75]|uniref:polyprenyl synthetase family protein n=1 Tax=unclassified Pseudarthrobacter TaxID=2647000 RepID=UPI002E81CB72|nr:MULTISPECIES: polyprenyl synthetase family protein [unclassified Pseudarthrobacter]MEE2522776.1 polyprenyl synthetase family protein [Pseudarthrobacter sp. J47]MEE2529637.1 polyprenyl synthetase family protein [Pseudarthrobacter sp. J75]MEE2569595.1 polyprenyl synthetase family protein [Pseudarthrobacter sp. J64]
MTAAEQLLVEQADYVAAVAAKLREFLAGRQEIMSAISPDIDPIMDSIANLVTGGKRLRALMCYWGWRGAGGEAGAEEIVTAGAALELFQAAALIHDDIIDRSDTRRGGPSVHRRFGHLHQEQGWALDGERFGQAAGILAGDLCLSFSEEAFTDIGIRAASGTRARLIFNLMRAEVMAGQYLDILEEVAGPVRDRSQAVSRAQSIIRFKSAKYSTEHPLALGGALAGAYDGLLRGYSSFALPLGEAFQLRDDVLGVFGDPVTTGKPAGDDLREGKRTVLVALALEQASESESAFIDRKLGSPELDDSDVAEIRRIIVDCGALQATELLITQYADAALTALADMPVDEFSRTALRKLAEASVSRAS